MVKLVRLKKGGTVNQVQGSLHARPTRILRRYGLNLGQRRDEQSLCYRSGGWYTRDGLLLGYGDLSRRDIERIKSNLRPSELFLVLKSGPFSLKSDNSGFLHDIVGQTPLVISSLGVFLISQSKKSLGARLLVNGIDVQVLDLLEGDDLLGLSGAYDS